MFRNLTTLGITSIAALAIDSGTISSDIQKQFEQTNQQPKSSSIVTPGQTATKTTEDSTKVLVKSFEIIGNTLISSAELESVVADSMNKELTFDQLNDVARTLANYYRSKGYSARAFLPPQEVEGGKIKLMILEGKLSAIEIDTKNSENISSSRAKAILETAHPTGKLLEIDKLQRGLLLLNDSPGITSTGELEAGESTGDSKLKVKVQDSSIVDGMFLLSNNGQRSTGIGQAIASITVNSPTGTSDQLSIQAMGTFGIRYGKLGYSLPVGSSGTRMGISQSAMSYKVIDGTQADGSSTDTQLNFSYPLIRSGSKNLNLSMNVNHKHYENYTLDVKTSDKSINSFTTGVDYTNYDQNGSTSFGVSAVLGELDLSNISTDLAQDALTKNSNGKYAKYTFKASRNQIITPTTTLGINLNAQKSSKNLDSSEKIYLGGSSGIRAYPSNEAGGDDGYLLNVELSRALPNNFMASVFYDYGRIAQNHTLYANFLTTTNPENIYSLQGWGASLAYSYRAFSIKGTFAKKIGTNPNTQSDGSDNDGTHDSSRIWLSATMTF